MSIPELIDKILLITTADNQPKNIRVILRRYLQKIYDDAYVAGQMSVLEVEE